MKKIILIIGFILLCVILQAEILKEEKMEKNILVAYASVAGSTVEVAEFIAKTMSDQNFNVDLMPAEDVQSVEKYDFVIVGSPVYMGSWKKPAKDFVKIYAKDLKNIPTAYFLTCLALTKENPNLAEVEKYLKSEREILKPVSEGNFAGRMDFSKLSFLHKLIVKMIGAKEGDFRNWTEIEKWTLSLKEHF